MIDAYGAGGSAAATPVIHNYPGFTDAVSGTELVRRIAEQAQRLGANFALTNPAAGLATGAGGLVGVFVAGPWGAAAGAVAGASLAAQIDPDAG